MNKFFAFEEVQHLQLPQEAENITSSFRKLCQM